MAVQKIAKQVKEVTALARVEFKNDPRKVVYQCLSSNGVDKYNTFLFDGKACSCTCLATKPCYHMIGCEAKEASRKTAPVAEAEAFIAKVQTEKAAKMVAPRQQEDWSSPNGSLYREVRNFEVAPSGRACPMR